MLPGSWARAAGGGHFVSAVSVVAVMALRDVSERLWRARTSSGPAVVWTPSLEGAVWWARDQVPVSYSQRLRVGAQPLARLEQMFPLCRFKS